MSMIWFKFYNNMKLLSQNLITLHNIAIYICQRQITNFQGIKIKHLQSVKMEQESQPISQHEDGEPNQGAAQATDQASCAVKLMIGYLYFVQGFLLSISATTPYVYPELPDYFTLSLFSLAALPFSFKFVTAPILEKYTNLAYGKRKTWIVFSQIAANITVIVCSFYSQLGQAQIFATISFFMYFFLSLQDISLDALCLKQLGDPKMMSMIQAGAQSTGVILGGLILLKSTSLEFAQKIGLDHPIANYQTVLICFSIFLLIPTLLIHFKFTQKIVEADSRATNESLLKVFSIYRYFFKKQYRYCRNLIFLMLYYQGFNFFLAGYSYQLIEKGFSRDTMNTIDNIQNVVITGLVFVLGVRANVFGLKKTLMFQLILTLATTYYLWIFFPTSLVPVIITNVALGVLSQWDFLLSTQVCANFPETGATGMLYTMNASGANLGKNLFIHTAILKKLPWKTVSFVGLAMQIPLILVFIPKIMDLIEEGETRLDILEEAGEKEEKGVVQKLQTDGTK